MGATLLVAVAGFTLMGLLLGNSAKGTRQDRPNWSTQRRPRQHARKVR